MNNTQPTPLLEILRDLAHQIEPGCPVEIGRDAFRVDIELPFGSYTLAAVLNEAAYTRVAALDPLTPLGQDEILAFDLRVRGENTFGLPRLQKIYVKDGAKMVAAVRLHTKMNAKHVNAYKRQKAKQAKDAQKATKRDAKNDTSLLDLMGWDGQ